MSKQPLLDNLRIYWPLILVFVSLIVGWTTMGATIQSVNDRVVKIEKKVETIDQTYIQIQKDLVEIRTSLKFIEQKIK